MQGRGDRGREERDIIDSIWVGQVSIWDGVMPRMSPHVVEPLAIRNRTPLPTLGCGETVKTKRELVVLYEQTTYDTRLLSVLAIELLLIARATLAPLGYNPPPSITHITVPLSSFD